ncbi:MAG TPA: 5-formyltetrahydrofolate cyclo-ligase [Gelria sp.]|jgi:5-formyltetrahydrofolate cyclo-ligase|nr:5-formyltetrahydrofolate cyclo-ligase [Gelria sp.]
MKINDNPSSVSLRDNLREQMMVNRNKLSQLEVEKLSQKVCQRLEELQPLQQAQVIMGFSSIRNEVNLRPWLQKLQKQGRTILLPRVEGDSLQAVEYKSGEDMGRGSFGIQEPQGEPFAVDKIDVVIVPALVFDANGYRLGYGKGYYDRFLPGLNKQCFKCGVCYEFQVVNNIYPHPGDVPVHWIVTDHSEIAVDWDFF